MIRHALVEGLVLLRSRFLVSVGLGCALAIPLALGGLIGATTFWLGPLVSSVPTAVIVPVLLHPQMDDVQRGTWMAEVARAHPTWTVRAVPADELGRRMAAWFPYLAELFRHEGSVLLPPLVEIETDTPEAVAALLASPRVIAVGPRSSLLEVLGRSARRLALLLGGCAVALLAAAGLLAAVWVHLELFRHADEITIMRLVGATEGTVRGPFVVAVSAPGLFGGFLAAIGMTAACRTLSRLAVGLGLPPVMAPWWLVALCLCCGVALPLLAAILTLGRHAHLALES